MNNVETSTSLPHTCSGSNENPVTEMITAVRTQKGSEPQGQQAQNMFSDPNGTQDLGGMMKIVPSDLNVSGVIPFLFLLARTFLHRGL